MKHSHHILSSLAMVIMMATANICMGQASMADIFSGKTTITWIGLDFTEAKFVSDLDFPQLTQEGPSYLRRWNNLIQTESDKFDMCEALKLAHCKNDVSATDEFNVKVDLTKMTSREPFILSKDKVEGMLSKYNVEGEGIGVVFIVSSFDKPAELADYYVTFFDMGSKALLHTEKITGKPQGFGLRNYWAGSVYHVLKQIKSDHYKKWNKELAK